MEQTVDGDSAVPGISVTRVKGYGEYAIFYDLHCNQQHQDAEDRSEYSEVSEIADRQGAADGCTNAAAGTRNNGQADHHLIRVFPPTSRQE